MLIQCVPPSILNSVMLVQCDPDVDPVTDVVHVALEITLILFAPLQLLKELIDRKTSYSESSDPIEMGRQWLDLQRLRMKARKKVDTRASKGRKIRYVHEP